MRAINPFLLGQLTNYFVDPAASPVWYPYLYATGLTLSSFAYILADTYMLMKLRVLGWNAKSAVVGLMYKKVSIAAKLFFFVGKINLELNLVSP